MLAAAGGAPSASHSHAFFKAAALHGVSTLDLWERGVVDLTKVCLREERRGCAKL